MVALAGISVQYILYLNFQSVHKMWHLIKTVFVFITSLSLRTMWQQWANDWTCTHRGSRNQHMVSLFFWSVQHLNHTGFYVCIKTTKINSNLWHTVKKEPALCLHSLYHCRHGVLGTAALWSSSAAGSLLRELWIHFPGWGKQLPLLPTVSLSSHSRACNCALNLPKAESPDQMLGPFC